MNAAKAVIHELAVYDGVPVGGRYLYAVLGVAHPYTFDAVVAAKQFQTFADVRTVDHRGGRVRSFYRYLLSGYHHMLVIG